MTMSVGEKAELDIEPEWAYGKKGLEGRYPYTQLQAIWHFNYSRNVAHVIHRSYTLSMSNVDTGSNIYIVCDICNTKLTFLGQTFHCCDKPLSVVHVYLLVYRYIF